MKQINQTNCKNCGAPLHFEIENRLAVCKYCNTEYHLDNLGRIKEYTVELELFGRRMKFYINEIKCEPRYIESTRCMDESCTYVCGNDVIELSLTSY